MTGMLKVLNSKQEEIKADFLNTGWLRSIFTNPC